MQTLRLKKYIVLEFKIQAQIKTLLKIVSGSLLAILVTRPRLMRQTAPGEYEEVERHRYEPFIL